MASLVGFGISKLLGGGRKERQAVEALDPSRVVTGFNAGGLTGRRDGMSFNVTASPLRESRVRGVGNALTRGISDVRGLESRVRPGFGLLSQSIRESFGASRRRALGNARDQFARRRIQGSSFAQDTLARIEAEFAEREAASLAEANLAEIELTNDLMQRRTQMDVARAEVFLNELNLQAQLGANFATQVTQTLGSLQTTKSNLLADIAASRSEAGGQMATELFSAGASALSGGSLSDILRATS